MELAILAAIGILALALAMREKDPFTSFYDELLTNNYDSVDRIVLNGYCKQCLSPGGFRNWWRSLPDCGDDNLDDPRICPNLLSLARCVWVVSISISLVF